MVDKAPFIAFGLVIVGAIILITLAIKDYDTLMDECLADGKKRYECIGILKSNTVVVR